MRTLEGALTGHDLGAVDALDTEPVERQHRCTNVDDGIDGANFMEVHFFHADTVRGGLGLRQRFEGAQHPLLCFSREPGCPHNPIDIAQTPLRCAFARLHQKASPRQPPTPSLLRRNRPTIQR